MPSYQERLAEVCRSLADRQTRQGDYAAAEQSLRLMLQATDRLLARFPRVKRYRALEGEARLALGWNCRDTGRFPDAEKAFLRAREIFAGIVKDDPKSLHYNYRLGWAHNGLGILYRHMTRFKDAEAQHREALKVRDWLAGQKPADREYRANLASTCTNLANLYPEGPVKAAEAERLFLRSIAIQEKLVQEPVHIDQDVLDYAMSYNNLGIAYQLQNKHADAEKAWKKSLEIREGLLKLRPKMVALLNDLAMSHANLSAHYARLKDQKNTEASLRKAIDASERAVKLRPGAEAYVTRLARLSSALADMLWGQGRTKEALAGYDRAAKVLAPWEKKGVAGLPPAMHSEVLTTHVRQAELLAELGRFKDSVAYWDRALAVAPAAEHGGIVYGRARTLALAGEHRGAVDDLLDLLARRPPAEAKFSLCGLYCLAVRAAEKDARLSATQRKDVADLYARRAVELLRECHKGGLLKQDRYRKALRGSKALSVLHPREDYKKLLAEADPPKKEEKEEE
jgi:tetratricopeptide (TPR) repeat protein